MGSLVVRPGATFCDVCAHPNGWAWVRIADRTWICEVKGIEVWRVELPVKSLYLRIASDPEGGVLALAQGDYPNGNLIAVYNGGAPAVLMPTFGQNVVAVDFLSGAFTAYVQVSATQARKLRFRGAEVIESSLFTIPETSQGFLDIRAGQPLLTDDYRVRMIRGRLITLPNEEAGMVVGQWGDKPGMAAFLVNEDVQFTPMTGLCYEPHVAALQDGYVVCARTERDGAAYRTLRAPWPIDPPEPVTVQPFPRPLLYGPLLGDGTEPGNCYHVKVAPDVGLLLEKDTRREIATFVEGGDLETIWTRIREAKRLLDLPVIAGADSRDRNWFPRGIDGAASIAWEVYPATPTENAAAVEQRVQRGFDARQPDDLPVTLIGCNYTLSGWYQAPVRPLLQASENLARTNPDVLALLYFHGKERGGYLLETVPYLEALARAIPGVPETDDPRPDPVPEPEPEEPDVAFQSVPRDQVLDVLTWLRGDVEKAEPGIYPNIVGHPLDDEGIAAWVCDNYVRYRQTMDHQPAKERLFNDIWNVVHPDDPRGVPSGPQ